LPQNCGKEREFAAKQGREGRILEGEILGELGERSSTAKQRFLKPNSLFSDLKTIVSKPKLLGLYLLSRVENLKF